MVHIFECPACGSNELVPHLTCEDHTVSHETFQIVMCGVCNLAITSPQPESADLGRYYESEEYISHSGKTTGLSSVYHLARSYHLKWKKSLIKTYATKGSVLDFGCGTGEFLQTMKKAGWSIFGVEPSDLARQKASGLKGSKIVADIHQLHKDNFTIITLWHVLEHLPNLNEMLQMLLSKLDTNGTLFLAVPNYESADAQKYQSHWAGYDVPRHLWHFSKKSMTHLVAKAGAKIVNIVPMKLDAYYVSILSEKYRRNNHMTVSCLVSGILAGLTSNARAGQDNYSSLIYIVQKS